MACDRTVITHEPTVEQKAEVNVEAKQLVAAKAAALIQPEDFIYLDAGTTTACMLSYLTEKSATFVTNAVAHAKTLAAAGFRVYLVGGELKVHGGCGGEPGTDDTAELSFYQRLLRYERDQQAERTDHTRYE